MPCSFWHFVCASSIFCISSWNNETYYFCSLVRLPLTYPKCAWHQDRLADWPSVVTWLWLLIMGQWEKAGHKPGLGSHGQSVRQWRDSYVTIMKLLDRVLSRRWERNVSLKTRGIFFRKVACSTNDVPSEMLRLNVLSPTDMRSVCVISPNHFDFQPNIRPYMDFSG
jgi:hypothetical protein